MPRFITTWLITAVSLLITTYIIPGFKVESVAAAVIAAVVIGLVSAIVRPVLFLLTLPITILTLGLFSFVVNALTIWVASAFSPGFEIEGFLPALLGSLVLSVVSGFLNGLFGKDD
ncbi:MAG: phage holin family protein [Thermosynechococcaceae cyanobacterium MS004]|nr:phage holin family protein [Thermosynechococcaceae cyanobacterium MS004]